MASRLHSHWSVHIKSRRGYQIQQTRAPGKNEANKKENILSTNFWLMGRDASNFLMCKRSCVQCSSRPSWQKMPSTLVLFDHSRALFRCIFAQFQSLLPWIFISKSILFGSLMTTVLFIRWRKVWGTKFFVLEARVALWWCHRHFPFLDGKVFRTELQSRYSLKLPYF